MIQFIVECEECKQEYWQKADKSVACPYCSQPKPEHDPARSLIYEF